VVFLLSKNQIKRTSKTPLDETNMKTVKVASFSGSIFMSVLEVLHKFEIFISIFRVKVCQYFGHAYQPYLSSLSSATSNIV
jgi:hypothetical protein